MFYKIEANIIIESCFIILFIENNKRVIEFLLTKTIIAKLTNIPTNFLQPIHSQFYLE